MQTGRQNWIILEQLHVALNCYNSIFSGITLHHELSILAAVEYIYILAECSSSIVSS